MNILAYDYSITNYTDDACIASRKILSIGKIKSLCAEFKSKVITNNRNLEDIDITIGHFADPNIPADFLPVTDKNQIVICVTKTNGYTENLKHKIIQQHDCKRAILYVRDMNAINTNILKRLLSMKFDDAKKIIESGGAWVLSWQIDPFNTKKEALVALYTLCQGYLAVHKKESLESLYSLTRSSKQLVVKPPDKLESDFWMDIVYNPDIISRLASEMRIKSIDGCCVGTLFESIKKLISNNESESIENKFVQPELTLEPELILEVCQFIRKQLKLIPD